MKKVLIPFFVLFHLFAFSVPKSLSLKKAISIALKNNFSWKMAKIQDRLYKRLSKEYLREYFPKLNLGFSKEQSRIKRGTDSRSYKIDLSFEQLIYDGGKISDARESARLQRKINFIETKGIGREVKNKVISQFFKIAGIQKKLEVQKKHLNSLKQQVALSREEFKLGEITKLDFLEIKTKHEETLYQLAQLKSQLEIEMLNFKKLVKIGLSEKIVLEESFSSTIEKKRVKDIKEYYSLNKLLSIAFNNRKEMLSFFLAHKKAKRELSAIRRSYIPKVSLVGGYSLAGEKFPRNKSYNIGIVFSLSFGGSSMKTNYDGRSINNGQGQSDNYGGSVSVLDNPALWGSQYIQKQIAVFQSKEKWENFKKDLSLELRSLYNNTSILAFSFRTNLKKLALIKERVALSRLKLKLGEIKRLDIIKLETELMQSKLDLINTWVSYVISVANIENKIGLPGGSLKLYALKG